MDKFDIKTFSMTLSSASHSDPEPAPRLIVLFPDSETDSLSLSRQIWEIAHSLQLNVLLISLTKDYEEEAQLRRKLITMASIIKGPNVSTEILIEHGNDWVRRVRKIWRTGDSVACFANQKVGLMRKPLDQALKSSLDASIYILSGYLPAKNPISKNISNALYWLGSLTIISGFFWAEVKVVQLPQDWAHTALMYASVFVEIAFVWLWNSLFT